MVYLLTIPGAVRCCTPRGSWQSRRETCSVLGVRDFRVKTVLTASPAFLLKTAAQRPRETQCPLRASRLSGCVLYLLPVDCARWSCLAVGAQLSISPGCPRPGITRNHHPCVCSRCQTQGLDLTCHPTSKGSIPTVPVGWCVTERVYPRPLAPSLS